jgi:anaerobic dimethyl sulfoxide reductase subunit B (iron-sulfur subunit)
MTYAFYFDSSSCTGCKACQAACKDKNNLQAGVLWRRVYEISGGEWTRSGGAWINTVFAYNLSIACNHCVHPKCAGVCPVDAYEVRPDGIVLINTQKCIGCGYCAWACPYDAPQVDKSDGVMTKCNLCYDNLDAGLPPACVAACPLRCLDLVDASDPKVADMGQALWKIPGEGHPFPLPVLSRTEPHLVIKSHPALNLVGTGTKVGNREEISPSRPRDTATDEIPLIIFTLFAQMAIGAFAIIFMVLFGLFNSQIASQIMVIPLLAVAVCITVALVSSFFHLKSPQNAWQVLNHLRKSWLSREILFTLGFAGLLVPQVVFGITRTPSSTLEAILAPFTFFCGLLTLYCMHRVYQLRNKPGWNTVRTLFEFTLSTIGLGCWLMATLLPHDAPPNLIVWIAMGGTLALLASLLISISTSGNESQTLIKWRSGFLLAGLVGGIALILGGSATWIMGSALIFIIALVEEIIGRWVFYLRRNPGI